jgi:hypothetical protein
VENYLFTKAQAATTKVSGDGKARETTSMELTIPLHADFDSLLLAEGTSFLAPTLRHSVGQPGLSVLFEGRLRDAHT